MFFKREKPKLLFRQPHINDNGMHSIIYTNIIFIGMEVKITFYTGKYTETLHFIKITAIIIQTSVIFLVSPAWIIRVLFFYLQSLEIVYHSLISIL